MVERVNLYASQSKQTYMDLLQGGYKKMRDLSYLAEGEASDGAISLMQSHSFTVTISGDVTFGQNHTAVCKACRQEKSLKTKSEITQRDNSQTVEHFAAPYQWP